MQTVQSAKVFRYSKEKFGYLVVFDDGSIRLYNHSAQTILESSPTYGDLADYQLKKMTIESDFYLNSPLIVWFEVTRKCNLTCTHCYIEAGEPRENEFSFQEIKEILNNLNELGVHSLAFSGGEPYMRKDFSDILEYAASLDFVISVVTNGSYLTPKTLSRFPKGNCRITLSVDGFDAHNAIRGGHSSFDFLSKKIGLLKEMGVPHSISTVITKANISELNGLLNWCVDNDVVFRTVAFNPLGRGLDNLNIHELSRSDASESAELFMIQKRFEEEKDKEIGPCVSKYFDYSLTFQYMTRREHCSRTLAYIASDGNVYPCVSCASTEVFNAGNVRDAKFSDLWRNSFNDMRAINWQHFIDEDCHSCSFNSQNYFCASRCPVLSMVIHNKPVGCGASEFAREDLRIRTARLQEECGYD